MSRYRRPSARTQAKQAKASTMRQAAREALRSGETLRVSNETHIGNGTVHHALARVLVRRREAEYLPDPQREGWLDMTQIRQRTEDVR